MADSLARYSRQASSGSKGIKPNAHNLYSGYCGNKNRSIAPHFNSFESWNDSRLSQFQDQLFREKIKQIAAEAAVTLLFVCVLLAASFI
ncbi:MAG: hypothetical protein RL680_976 [Actinomycetota bacterium]